MYTFSEFLLGELKKKQLINPKFSKRAFAKLLGVSPGFLSNLMTGKKGISRHRVFQICKALGYDKNKTEFIADIATAEFSRNERRRQNASKKINQGNIENVIDAEAFTVISQWYHLVILEQTNLKNPRWDVDHISKSYNISHQEAEDAIKRLSKLELLRRDESNRYKAGNNSIHLNEMNEAIRIFHKGILKRLEHAIENRPHTERQLGANVLSIQSDDYHNATQDIINFRKEFAKKYGTSSGDKILCLGTYLFPLD